MRIGAIFPQTEFGNDPIAIRDYAQTVEGLGFHHIMVYDHVVGAGLATRPDWTGPYSSTTPFHEVFVLLGYWAGVTQRIELVTGVLILPQRQTALVAKQAAEIDVLSRGRLRLGIGVGWNEVEFQALNEQFVNRGVRSEEQIALLRALWSYETVTFHGKWHTIDDAGIAPRPIRPIPIWIGGSATATVLRVARIGDGWFPQMTPEAAAPLLERMRIAAEEAGRDGAAIGIEARLNLSQTDESQWERHVQEWRDVGATHLSVNTMGNGYTTPTQHLDALRKVRGMLEDFS